MNMYIVFYLFLLNFALQDHHDKMESRRGSGRSLVSEVVTTFVYKGMEMIFYLLRDVKDKNTLHYVYSSTYPPPWFVIMFWSNSLLLFLSHMLITDINSSLSSQRSSRIQLDMSSLCRKIKNPWILRSESKRISQSELGKRPDPFFLLDLLDWFEESKYGWLADDVKRLCELKRKLLNGSVSVDLPQESVTTEDCSGSDASPERYNEEDSSSKTPTDDDNETHLNGVYEEEEAELWRQMAFAQESSKVTVENVQDNDPKQTEDCEHSFIYKDDVGEVCRVCGLIKTPIENIIEVVYYKPKRSGRAYTREQEEETETTRMDFTETHSSSHTNNILGDKMFIHPRHDYEMRPHQIVGFKFLCNNLTSEEPGGCILAHAPGSGKTFLLFSFLQSFMAMDPQAKPLIVLPKGIIESWKREFTKWAVENIPLYSVKAESRKQQLKVLREWVEERSILFLGYQQFAKIICDDSIIIDDEVSEDCKRILLEKPTLLILDEGHTSRNKETNMLISLARVRTPRKMVLTVWTMGNCH
ncbi:hypothetical protein YC2023_023999 [Brassica napus]